MRDDRQTRITSPFLFPAIGKRERVVSEPKKRPQFCVKQERINQTTYRSAGNGVREYTMGGGEKGGKGRQTLELEKGTGE